MHLTLNHLEIKKVSETFASETLYSQGDLNPCYQDENLAS